MRMVLLGWGGGNGSGTSNAGTKSCEGAVVAEVVASPFVGVVAAWMGKMEVELVVVVAVAEVESVESLRGSG